MTPSFGKPLFIPLKTEFYRAFERGEKTTEFRLYGPRWNERTCAIGRPVVLSMGYGKRNRLSGFVSGFRKSAIQTLTEAWRSCYGDAPAVAACIEIVIRRQMTADEFIVGYCARSGRSRAWFDNSYVALPCACRSPMCQGWAKVSNRPEAIANHSMLYSPVNAS